MIKLSESPNDLAMASAAGALVGPFAWPVLSTCLLSAASIQGFPLRVCAAIALAGIRYTPLLCAADVISDAYDNFGSGGQQLSLAQVASDPSALRETIVRWLLTAESDLFGIGTLSAFCAAGYQATALLQAGPADTWGSFAALAASSALAVGAYSFAERNAKGILPLHDRYPGIEQYLRRYGRDRSRQACARE
jgi:hypothetical protein